MKDSVFGKQLIINGCGFLIGIVNGVHNLAELCGCLKDVVVTAVFLACGTGTCAALTAAVVCGKADRTANVYVRGGVLSNEWNAEDNMIYMTGPAEIVFEGEVNLKYE